MQQKLVKVGAMVVMLTALVHTRPVRRSEDDFLQELSLSGRDSKRTDVFMSRGWGAGGMPFNVLYTQTPKAVRPLRTPTASMPIVVEPPLVPDPQPLRSVRPEAVPYKYPRRPYSVIPQLFVSYGWGPVGK